ncbi:methyltransferase domain-containing protein [Antrihabitans cavernicola]|uniref:Methyltransferase domain-containing protein n=1 Tax=Antrihabitans cavernicola TaxID=2495913 RepID=A0A5A7S7P3_9NOCA|nr:methyltransferase domain-containing protein [Spelaeibacter cavernicola]KAA0020188.1 methyltransferase domain-containing protein [Spelaeibacter cavernicola]
MVAQDKVFAGSIPYMYERYFVPLIFEPYARDLATRVALADPHRVLETAAGTGVLTRHLARRLPSQTRLVATDLNEPMLAVAAAKLHDDRIEWRHADALALPFADVITQALAKMFPLDPPRFLARTPHGYHDVEAIEQHVTAAGFSSVSIESVDDVSRADSPTDPAVAYCQGSPLCNEIEPERLVEATHVAATALAERFGTGAVEGKIRAHVVTAVR